MDGSSRLFNSECGRDTKNRNKKGKIRSGEEGLPLKNGIKNKRKKIKDSREKYISRLSNSEYNREKTKIEREE